MLSDDLIQEQAYLVSRGVRPLALLESVSLEPAEMVNTFVRLNQVAVDPAIPFVLPRRDMNCAMTGVATEKMAPRQVRQALTGILHHLHEQNAIPFHHEPVYLSHLVGADRGNPWLFVT